MTDYLQAVKDKKVEMSELTTRMNTDEDLLYLKQYIMKDSQKSPKPIPDIVNVTLNKPALFAANVISSLSSTTEQIVVESDDKQLDTDKVEDFIRAAFASANERNRQRGLPSLNDFTDVQSCIRGRVARRILFRMVNDILVPDIMSWDTKFVYYEPGEIGLKWAAYETTRSKGLIEAEYSNKQIGKKVLNVDFINRKAAVVTDVWDTSHNEVWIDDRLLFEQSHTYGFTPVVLQIVPLGYGDILLSTSRLQHEGESIFFLIRDIIPEINRLLSMLQTLNLREVKAPLIYNAEGGKNSVPPEHNDVTALGAVTSIGLNEKIAPIDFGQAKQAAQMVYAIMEKAMQEGSLASTDLGNLQFPLSAVALVEIGEKSGKVFMPRLQTKALLNQQTADMLIRQVRPLKGPVELGTPGHKRSFSVSDLDGEYKVSYKYFLKSPKIDIARQAVASQAKEWYPRKEIYKNVLEVEDPDEMMREWYKEMAEKIDSLILRHRVIINLLELGERGDEDAQREAQIMAASMGMSLDQIKRGELPPPPPEEKPTKPILPLLGEGGQVGGIPSSAQQASELTRTPREGTPKGE